MFCTSVGFSIDLHYCNGDFKSFSLLGEAKSCHTKEKVCPHHAAMQVEKNDSTCCANVTYEVKDLDQEYHFVSDSQLSDTKSNFMVAFVSVFHDISLPQLVNYNIPKFEPLFLSWDIYVLLERFLL